VAASAPTPASSGQVWSTQHDGEAIRNLDDIKVAIDHEYLLALVTRIASVNVPLLRQVGADYATIEGKPRPDVPGAAAQSNCCKSSPKTQTTRNTGTRIPGEPGRLHHPPSASCGMHAAPS
jgi:hypothetical protein